MSELAQMVCGSCRRLLKYPRGARHCAIVVQSVDQVGQVNCGSCAVLLMYPYGASSVRNTTSALHGLFNRGTHLPLPILFIKLLM
ncbi:LSD1-type zinc finger protein [Prunus yedoensis var. nudiflora]|uniref:LSD1-type zinc finger protein n=1 Tax=Prunus yedoensis var. nudiflora TaxID=2094558 RepID=A0A314ZI22_PRUYE|nr:LSD1-type zinc finger protein [Prunus yedoensis var. nudiflora]